MTTEDLDSWLAECLREPEGAAAKRLLGMVMPLVRIVAATVPWSPGKRAAQLPKLFAVASSPAIIEDNYHGGVGRITRRKMFNDEPRQVHARARPPPALAGKHWARHPRPAHDAAAVGVRPRRIGGHARARRRRRL